MDVTTATNAVLIGILAIGTINGAIKGLVRQVVELAGVVGSFFLAVFFSGWLAEYLHGAMEIPYSPALVIAFLILFVTGLIVFHFVAISIQRIVHMTFLGWVDRFCGAALGLVIALLITSLLVSAVLELPISTAARLDIEGAEVSLFVRPIAPWLFDVVFAHGTHGIEFGRFFRRGGVV